MEDGIVNQQTKQAIDKPLIGEDPSGVPQWSPYFVPGGERIYPDGIVKEDRFSYGNYLLPATMRKVRQEDLTKQLDVLRGKGNGIPMGCTGNLQKNKERDFGKGIPKWSPFYREQHKKQEGQAPPAAQEGARPPTAGASRRSSAGVKLNPLDTSKLAAAAAAAEEEGAPAPEANGGLAARGRTTSAPGLRRGGGGGGGEGGGARGGQPQRRTGRASAFPLRGTNPNARPVQAAVFHRTQLGQSKSAAALPRSGGGGGGGGPARRRGGDGGGGGAPPPDRRTSYDRVLRPEPTHEDIYGYRRPKSAAAAAAPGPGLTPKEVWAIRWRQRQREAPLRSLAENFRPQLASLETKKEAAEEAAAAAQGAQERAAAAARPEVDERLFHAPTKVMSEFEKRDRGCGIPAWSPFYGKHAGGSGGNAAMYATAQQGFGAYLKTHTALTPRTLHRRARDHIKDMKALMTEDHTWEHCGIRPAAIK